MGPDACGGEMLRVRWAAPMIAMLLLYSCRSVPDSALLQGFDQHKQIFDRLAKMALEDHLSCPIPASGGANSVSESGLARSKLVARSPRVWNFATVGSQLHPLSLCAGVCFASHARSARGYAYEFDHHCFQRLLTRQLNPAKRTWSSSQVEGDWYLYFSA